MSKHRLVDEAIVALIQAALPGPKVRLLGAEDAKPETVGPLGEIIVRQGDPGNPEIDLSPPAYNYTREVSVELAAQTSAQIEPMLGAIGAAIAADRQLGGLCHWLDAEAPVAGAAEQRGVQPIAWADFPILASYTTASPLG